MENDGTMDTDRLLYELNRNMTQAVLPVSVLIGVECVIGLVGNILILIVFSLRYEKKTNFRYFVIVLAMTDLASCLTTLPGEIVSQTTWYTYKHEWVCKAKSFFNVLTVWSSASVLALLALDRYRKICRPFAWQFSQTRAARMCIACLVLSAVISVPIPVMWGKQNYEYRYERIKINVTVCEKSYQFAENNVPLVYVMTTFIAPVIILLLVTSFLNALIMKKLFCKDTEGRSCLSSNTSKSSICVAISMVSFARFFSGKTRDSSTAYEPSQPDKDDYRAAKVTDTDDESGTDNSKGMCISRTEPPGMGNKSLAPVISPEDQNVTDNGTATVIRTPVNDRSLTANQKKRRRRKSLIVLVLSAVFVVTTLVYTIMTPLVVDANGLLNDMPPSEKAAFFFFWRLYFVNSAINPIIYGFMDPKFRSGLLSFCKKS